MFHTHKKNGEFWVSLFVKPEKLIINNINSQKDTTTFLSEITPSDGESKPRIHNAIIPHYPIPNNSLKDI